MESTRYLIGIDLGTTNSVVAYVDAADDRADIRVFPVPQLAAPGEVREFPVLPSFLYFPTPDEQAAENLDLPWETRSTAVSGVMARERGALVPGRQVSSAKSWLCYPGVDRRAKMLPFEAEPPEPKISPVEASARFLMHLRDAWNHAHTPDLHFENQQLVLTVPASFDAEARELTVEAGNQAGLRNFILLEEPLAAFYAWIATHQDSLSHDLHDGALVLICDVGGGTTDFSLVRVRIAGEVEFERTAIGEHLLLGGDNLDAALAHTVEQRLDHKLSLRQRYALRRACTTAKERLLSDASPEHLPITVLGSGRAVVGGVVTAELDREEVLRTLRDGFLPLAGPEDLPHHDRRVGLRELGLPYAGDPAITRHLAEFLQKAAVATRCESPNGRPAMARPDAVLFNGGFFVPQIARERIIEAIAGWFGNGWRPCILHNEGMESAVATGAAYYAQVRHGRGIRIKAGSARTYYIGLRYELQMQAVCVLPAGVEEGTTLPLTNREFSVRANRPAAFNLYSSTTRCDPHGEVVALSLQDVHTHAPLVTVLRYGKMRDLELSVRLTASFTEVGTLELWCESLGTQHRWRLQFELRGEQTTGEALQSPHPHVSLAAQPIEPAVQLIRDVFGSGESRTEPEALVGNLEQALGVRRDSWPVSTVRQLADVFPEVATGRKKSPRHEVRWLNLYGFCLRPGFGAPGDHDRIRQTRGADNMAFPDDLQCQVERLVFWRRVAGGLNASRQHELYRDCSNLLGLGSKGRAPRLNRQLEQEGWRLLASLEQLPGAIRASLGHKLLARISKEPAPALFWALGRFGARIPVYGPLSCVAPLEAAEKWLAWFLELEEWTPETAFAASQLALRTGDARRDINDDLRQQVLAMLNELGFAEYAQSIARDQPSVSEVARALGESLPKGMQFLSTSDCLLPIAGLVESSGQ